MYRGAPLAKIVDFKEFLLLLLLWAIKILTS